MKGSAVFAVAALVASSAALPTGPSNGLGGIVGSIVNNAGNTLNGNSEFTTNENPALRADC